MKQHYFVCLKGLFFVSLPFVSLNLLGMNSIEFDFIAPACNETIHLSLNMDCEGIITPDIVLEAPDEEHQYRIFLTEPVDSVGNYTNNGTDRVRLLQTGTYTYAVIDSSGNFCYGEIIAEDKLAPFFTSLPRDTFVSCNWNLTELGIGATPVVATDNCGLTSVSFESAFIEEGNSLCDTTIIASLWKAVDTFGNSVIDTQRTVFFPATKNQLTLPGDITLSCGENTNDDIEDLTKTGFVRMESGKIVNAVFIPIDTFSFDGTTNNCNFGISKRDIIKNTDCEIEVIRYWEVIDWCQPNLGAVTIDTQIILLIDTLAPVFETHEHANLLNPLRVALNEDCRFGVQLAPPKASDNCDTMPQIEMYEVAQLVNGTYVPIGSNVQTISLPADTLRVGYRAFDKCTNQLKEDTTFIYLITADVIAPSAICASDLVIAVANDQGVILEAEIVDNGSFDNCGPITKTIRRQGIDTIWQSALFLPCEFIDSLLPIELRITDIAGNENFCWTSVRLEDKVSPICQNLPDEIITCDVLKSNDYGQSTDSNNNGVFEEAEWRDMTANQMLVFNEQFRWPPCLENISCNFFRIEQQYQRIEHACGMAQIKRRYRGVDVQNNVGDWAEQQITVNYQADWTVTFAPDWEGSCKEVIPIPFISIRNGACDNLSISITENRFTADEDFCVKIERIYQVINPCLLTPNTTPLTIVRPEDSNGNVVDSLTISSDSLGTNPYLLYKQILKIRSVEKPVLAIQNVDNCLTGIHLDTIFPKVEGVVNCAEHRTFSAAAKDCVGNDIIRFQWNFYEGEVLVDSGTGSTFTKAVLPNIEYSVQFIATDACNNQAEERQDFSFLDCAKPTLFTKARLFLELTKKEAEIWAADFDKGSHDNCTDRSTLLDNFRIWHYKLGIDPPTEIEDIKALPTNLTFTCTELSTQEVFIYAFDEADNFDYVYAFVIVQDNQESCLEFGRTTITGQIKNEKGVQLEQVTINLSGDMELDKSTDINGQYVFDLPKGKNYTIEPSKNSNPLNGITTFDLILINKHILGITPFNSPYQHIAADVNKSGTITAFDLVQLRQLILNIIPNFPTNDSWRFVDSRYEFTTETPEQEAFVEQIALNAIAIDEMEVNFIGIKIGDINGSAMPNSWKLPTARNAKEALTFKFQNRWIKRGEIIEVPFVINNLKHIEGLQLDLAFKDLEIVDLLEGVATTEHFNLKELKRGRLAVSWNKTTELITDNRLFSIQLKAGSTDLLSNLLTINKENMQAEAYSNDQEIMDIRMAFTSIIKQDKFELFQNIPNPFKNRTKITFYLPYADQVDLKIMDIQGRVLQQITKRYEIGFQEVLIDKHDLPTTGVLYYQLTVGNSVTTKKMIVLE